MLSEEQEKALKIRIVQLVKRTKKDIAELQEQTKPIPPENAIGRVSRMDAINNRAVNEASLQKAKNKLIQLQEAAKNISLGDYGVCMRCHAHISYERLHLMPEARKCISCAKRNRD